MRNWEVKYWGHSGWVICCEADNSWYRDKNCRDFWFLWNDGTEHLKNTGMVYSRREEANEVIQKANGYYPSKETAQKFLDAWKAIQEWQTLKSVEDCAYPNDSLRVTEFLDEFIVALENQLDLDHKRWGNTWLRRGLKGQEQRTFERYRDYWDQFKSNGTPIPWLKVAGGALICWIRENHPDILQNPENDCMELDI